MPEEVKEQLVAHRGDQSGKQTAPVENSLEAFEQAARGGARFIECDIQFSIDRIPVVIHDHQLQRLCNRDGVVSQLSIAELKSAAAPCFTLLTLSELMGWLAGWPEITLFVEIKDDARTWLEDGEIAALVSSAIPQMLLPRVVIISYEAEIVAACSEKIACAYGWVTDEVRDVPQKIQGTISYYFTGARHGAFLGDIKKQGLTVAVYTVDTPEEMRELISQGIDLVETNLFTAMCSV